MANKCIVSKSRVMNFYSLLDNILGCRVIPSTNFYLENVRHKIILCRDLLISITCVSAISYDNDAYDFSDDFWTNKSAFFSNFEKHICLKNVWLKIICIIEIYYRMV